jgi:hypothetical protein
MAVRTAAPRSQEAIAIGESEKVSGAFCDWGASTIGESLVANGSRPLAVTADDGFDCSVIPAGMKPAARLVVVGGNSVSISIVSGKKSQPWAMTSSQAMRWMRGASIRSRASKAHAASAAADVASVVRSRAAAMSTSVIRTSLRMAAAGLAFRRGDELF